MNTIKKNREFQDVYNNGKKSYGKYSLIFFKKLDENFKNSYGFVASKKVGNAVTRNRIKRLFREYARLNENKIKTSYKIIFVAKKIVEKDIKYQEVEKDLDRVFKIAKLVNKE